MKFRVQVFDNLIAGTAAGVRADGRPMPKIVAICADPPFSRSPATGTGDTVGDALDNLRRTISALLKMQELKPKLTATLELPP